LAITDVVATAQLTDEVKKNLELYTGCVSGAAQIDELKSMLEKAGFTNIHIKPKDESKEFISEWTSDRDIGDIVLSATIEAVKP